MRTLSLALVPLRQGLCTALLAGGWKTNYLVRTILAANQAGGLIFVGGKPVSVFTAREKSRNLLRPGAGQEQNSTTGF